MLKTKFLFLKLIEKTVFVEIIYYISEVLGALRCCFGLYDTFSSAMNMSLKYSETAPFLYQ